MKKYTTLLPSPTKVWEAPTKEVLSGTSPQKLSGPWRMMLLGDGSPTRHLRLLTGYEVEVELIAMEEEIMYFILSTVLA